jgi:predicted phosphodiesterase
LRTAVFSDVHGNLVALEAMLDDLRRRPVDALVCLGDALQGGPQPRECLDRIRELGCPVVLGNADDFLCTLESEAEPTTAEQLDVARWSREQLGADGLELVGTYAPTFEVELGGGVTMLCFHGSPSSYDDVILPSTPEEEVRAHFAQTDAAIVTGGHVHMQWTRPIAHRTLVNPGSVGLGYDHEQPDGAVRFRHHAEYAVVSLNGGAPEIELRRVPFDAELVVRAVRARGRPHPEQYVAGWS